MIKEAIILCGGLGTRLQPVIENMPKALAPLGAQPFLYYLLQYLKSEKFRHIILCLGYQHESISSYLRNIQLEDIQISYSIEAKPLGTGGAVKNALPLLLGNTFFIFNGDTFFKIATDSLIENSKYWNTDISIALLALENINRYGSVELSSVQRIKAFHEKQAQARGIVNGGVYYMYKSVFDKSKDLETFSLEKDILEKRINEIKIHGVVFQNYFIDRFHRLFLDIISRS